MQHFSYRWYSYDLLVGCPKCGDKIPFQGIAGNPQCGDCGHTLKYTWAEVLKQAEVEDLKKRGRNGQSSTILGKVNINLSTAWVEGIPCGHCKKTMEISVDTQPGDITCSHCNKPSPATTNEQIKDMVFYKSGNSAAVQTGTIDMVAVRCASCGAPLQADPTKSNYNCQFCHTENILPPSMRRKVVLDDMYVGVQVLRLPPELAMTVGNSDKVRRVLNENKRTDYTDDQLNELMVKHHNDLALINFIRNGYKYQPPANVYEQLWNTTQSFPVLAEAGRALNKSFEEIDQKGQGMSGRPQKQQQAKPKKAKNSNGAGKTEKYFVIAVIIAIILYFGWKALRQNGII